MGKDMTVMDLDNELNLSAPNMVDPMELSRPPFDNPATQLGECLVDEAGKEIKMNFDHGTTTLGFKYKGGTILAVDSR